MANPYEMTTVIQTVSTRTPGITLIDIIETACTAAIIYLGLWWLHQWELPKSGYVVHVHLIVLVAATLSLPINWKGFTLVLCLDTLALVTQFGMYSEKWQPYDLDVNTHDESKEYTKLGLLTGLTMCTFLRLAGACDWTIPGQGYDLYKINRPQQHQQYQQQQQQMMYQPQQYQQPQPMLLQPQPTYAVPPSGYIPVPQGYTLAPKVVSYS